MNFTRICHQENQKENYFHFSLNVRLASSTLNGSILGARSGPLAGYGGNFEFNAEDAEANKGDRRDWIASIWPWGRERWKKKPIFQRPKKNVKTGKILKMERWNL